MQSTRAFRGHFGWMRVCIALAAAGQLPVAAGAESPANGLGAAPLELAWVNPAPVGENLAEVTPAEAPNLFPGELFAGGDEVPALEFSLNPTREEILLGWRFEF